MAFDNAVKIFFTEEKVNAKIFALTSYLQVYLGCKRIS
jgi:hypothetical protein